MSKRLYLMRHGETLFNTLKKIQGACDSPLTNRGKYQAEVARAYFLEQNISFGHYYTSTQERASDTLEIICPNQPYVRLKGLKEWDFGLYEGESETLNPPHKPGENSYGTYFADYGGEKHTEVQARMNQTLRKIMSEAKEDVLAVSHGGAMYMFIQKWLPFSEVKKIKFSNCAILVLDFDDESGFHFVESISHTFSE